MVICFASSTIFRVTSSLRVTILFQPSVTGQEPGLLNSSSADLATRGGVGGAVLERPRRGSPRCICYNLDRTMFT